MLKNKNILILAMISIFYLGINVSSSVAGDDAINTLAERYSLIRKAAVQLKFSKILERAPNQEHVHTLLHLLNRNVAPTQPCHLEPALEKALRVVQMEIAPLVAQDKAKRILTRNYLLGYRAIFRKTPHEVREDAKRSGDSIQKFEAVSDLFPAPPNPIQVWDHLRATRANEAGSAMELLGRALRGDSLDLFDPYARHGELRGTIASVEDGTFVKTLMQGLVARKLPEMEKIYERLEGAKTAIVKLLTVSGRIC